MSYHLRLNKALSYCGIVTATQKRPDVFVEDEATAALVLDTGYFKLVGEIEAQPGKEEEKEQEQNKTLEEMTVPELETFASYKGVSLKGITKKADMIAKLKEELGAEETENEVYYGSPTMTDLQEH